MPLHLRHGNCMVVFILLEVSSWDKQLVVSAIIKLEDLAPFEM